MISKLNFDDFILFDGAMGTMLQRNGLLMGELPESYNILHPEVIEEIHREYIEAGCDVISTNTFGANRLKLKSSKYSVSEVVERATEIARKAARDKLVALDIGPTGHLLEPYGDLSFEEAYDLFAEQIRAGEKAGADLVLIETMSDIYEVKAAILAAKENSSLPVICTMTYQKDGRTLMGTDPLTMVNILQGLGVSALGVNCSLGPAEMLPIVEDLLKYSKVPVIVQPNAGLPRIKDGNTVFDIEPHEFVEYAKLMAATGVTIFGGCCGTDPSFIKALRKLLDKLTPVKRKIKEITAVSSSRKTEVLGEGIKIIGERINPTGKKKFKEALKNNDIDYILTEALNQKEAGAHILDVNVGLPEIDEKAVMTNAVKELQNIINLPLQIDSVRSDVIEAAVRVYNGKPLINSVNGKKSSMETIFPIVKKYGGCVIGLTLDENGIPDSAEERYRIAKKIIDKAAEYGIGKEDIVIDCLVLTASAQQAEVKETVKAVSLVKERLGVKTTLGVSNVSFGLPQRELINRTFLAATLAAGLDAPILNPMAKDMMDTVNTFNVLWNNDKEAKEYIKGYSVNKDEPGNQTAAGVMDLDKAIIGGIKEEAAEITRNLLKEKTGMEIVNNHLIPSLDIVGKKYETGEIFLPQLIQSAESVKKSFEVIRETINGDNAGVEAKGKIVLATVKGDVHDIGKNIVKILLQNYGYEVLDLGKDVPEETIIGKVKEENIKLVGLSALMTSTVKSMEEIIRALKDRVPDCRVMVGGAVLNEEYARLIGADYYGKDANQAVKIAQEFFKS